MHYRIISMFLLIATAALGLLSRVVPLGIIVWDKYLGDVVYAAVFYFGLCLIIGRGILLPKICATAFYVTSIELFQLTPIPRQLNQSSNALVKLFAYIVLGSTFSWRDLLAYAVGIVLAIIVDKSLSTQYST